MLCGNSGSGCAMAEIILCPSCQRQLQFDDQSLGDLAQCPKCGHRFLAATSMTATATSEITKPAAAPSRSALSNRWQDEAPEDIDIRGPRLRGNGFLLDIGLGRGGVVDRQLADLYRFSLPALLHYEDRMSMALGREIRLPYLDYRLVTLLLPLDPRWKMRQGWSKWVFRKAMERDLPPEIVWRRDKQGFANPQPV